MWVSCPHACMTPVRWPSNSSVALERYGTMPLAEVMAPAIRLAAEGFVVDSGLSRSLEGSQGLLEQFAGKDVYYKDEEPLRPGTRFVQPVLARSLRQER